VKAITRLAREPHWRGTLMIVLLLFALGLVGFYRFAAELGDGLEVTMEEAGIEEGEPVWNAPLEYGDSYTASLLWGVFGFALVLGLTVGYGRLLRNLEHPDS